MQFVMSIGLNALVDPIDQTENSIIYNNFSFNALSERWINYSSDPDSTLIVVGYIAEFSNSIEKLHSFCRECVRTNSYKKLKQLSGNFVLIYYSEITRNVIVSSDISGCIPLYKIKKKDQLVITSSIKYASKISDGNNLNKRAFIASLSLFPLQPSETMLSDVERINPEQVIQFNTETAAVERIFSFSIPSLVFNSDYRNLNEDEAAELVKGWLEETTRIITDNGGATVPLSGGIDSSNIWAAVVRQSALQHNNVSAFTCGHGNYDSDESGMAEAWKAKYPEYQYIHNGNTFDDLVTYYLRQTSDQNPGLVLDRAHHSLFINKYLDRGVSSNVITGEGGDELFTGEASCFTDLLMSGQLTKAKKTLAALKETYSSDEYYTGSLFSYRRLFKPRGRAFNAIHHIRQPKLRPWLVPERSSDYVEVLGNNNVKQDFLVSPGRFSTQDMLKKYCYIQNSLFLSEYHHTYSERNLFVFHPLLEFRMLSLAYSIRPELHVANGSFKNILRLSLKSTAPNEILNNKSKHTNAVFYGDIADKVADKVTPIQDWNLVKNSYIDLPDNNRYRSKWIYIHLYCHEILLQNYDI